MPDEAEVEQGLRDAIAEAVDVSKYPAQRVAPVQGLTPEAETTEAAPAQPEPPGESTSGTVEDQKPPAPAEREAQSDLPDSYWGTPLTGLSDEQKQAVIARFEQEESYIKELQAQLSKQPERPAPLKQEEQTEVSDEDLLRAAGHNPEDPEVQQLTPYLLPMLRNQLALEERLEAQEQWVQANEANTQWNKALDELEDEFGALPGDRLNVLKEALDKGYGSPYETYFRLATPARQDVAKFVAAMRQKAQREEGQRDAAGALRPGSSTAAEPGIKKGMTLKDAVAIAAKEAEKETKLTWASALKSRLTRGAAGPS